MKNKKGQIQLSFSTIFSIIIIIVTLSVAFYVIRTFVVRSDCVKIQLFYEDLEKEVDEVWRSSSARQEFSRDLPNSVKGICFGKIDELKTKYPNEYKEISKYSRLQKNVFIYPPAKNCDSSVSYHKLEHVEISEAFCVYSKDKFLILLKKESGDDLVKICKKGENC